MLSKHERICDLFRNNPAAQSTQEIAKKTGLPEKDVLYVFEKSHPGEFKKETISHQQTTYRPINSIL